MQTLKRDMKKVNKKQACKKETQGYVCQLWESHSGACSVLW